MIRSKTIKLGMDLVQRRSVGRNNNQYVIVGAGQHGNAAIILPIACARGFGAVGCIFTQVHVGAKSFV